MKQINANKNKNHSRVSLSGIFNACCGRVVQKQQNVEDPRLQISGMAPLFYNSVRAFTLIELLVVVLIIGILAAVTLPQYQKTVEKARYAQLLVLIRAAANAQEMYYLANGNYATKFEELDIQMPTTNTTNEGGYLGIPGKAMLFMNTTSVGGWALGDLQSRFFCNYQHIEDEHAGKCACYGWTEKEVNLCQSLGGVLAGAYDSAHLDNNIYYFQ